MAALARMAPWVLLVLLAFSALCAVVYSRYITRPIVRLSGIAGKWQSWTLAGSAGRPARDEIGALGRSLDRMSQRLSAALTDLRAANDALLGEMERERELERQRSAFFAAASHELKTPVTILKGQLSGMLDGVGVYGTGEVSGPLPPGGGADGGAGGGAAGRVPHGVGRRLPPGGGGAVPP